MASSEQFCENYLVVDAKKASLYDIACILICSTNYLNSKSFYEEVSQDVERSILDHFRRRWLIFVSVLVQKVLILAKGPLTRIGSAIEIWLNLLSSNGGFFGLVINSILVLAYQPHNDHMDDCRCDGFDMDLAWIVGKVVKPDKSSDKFMSIVAELDPRMEMDASIRKGDGKYNRSLATLAAKFSYENEEYVKVAVQDHLKMEFIGFYTFWNDYRNLFSTYATMFQDTSDQNLIVVAFRGTGPFDADGWITDVDISWYELKDPNTSKPIGQIHGGFMKALGLQKTKGWPKELENPTDEHPFAYYTIREKLKGILEKNDNTKFIVTGHSSGAALAILFAGVLGLHQETSLLKRLEGVYTFGQPRVGDEAFGSYMMKVIKDHDFGYFRYVYSNDLVPRVPYDDRALFYKHFGQCLYFNSFYNGKVLEEEPNKNYFSLVWVIPKYITALWELIRGFILPFWKGKEYRETHTEKVFRLVGLVIPGVSAHGLKDYVDVSRLGTNLGETVVNMTKDEQVVKKND